jgi:hypothetical protein
MSTTENTPATTLVLWKEAETIVSRSPEDVQKREACFHGCALEERDRNKSVVRERTPMRLWTMRLMPSKPSRNGVDEPEVTKAVPVSGTRPAASKRSKVQW